MCRLLLHLDFRLLLLGAQRSLMLDLLGECRQCGSHAPLCRGRREIVKRLQQQGGCLGRRGVLPRLLRQGVGRIHLHLLRRRGLAPRPLRWRCECLLGLRTAAACGWRARATSLGWGDAAAPSRCNYR